MAMERKISKKQKMENKIEMYRQQLETAPLARKARLKRKAEKKKLKREMAEVGNNSHQPGDEDDGDANNNSHEILFDSKVNKGDDSIVKTFRAISKSSSSSNSKIRGREGMHIKSFLMAL
jgi:hypothetical protein